MKKLSILGLSALVGLAFTACDNYEEPDPAPQTNAQSSVLQASDINVISVVDPSTPYNLVSLNETYTPVSLATINTDALPDGYDFKAVGTMSANGKNADFQTEVVADENNPSVYTIVAYPDVLNAAYKNLTKDPSTGTVGVSFKLYTVARLGSQEAIIGGQNNVYTIDQFQVIPFAPATTILDSYILVVKQGDKVEQLVLAHTGEGSVYDTPNFSVKLNATAGMTWYVAPAPYSSNLVTWGPEDGNQFETSGKLFTLVGEDAQGATGAFTSTMPYLFTVNMETLEYSYTVAIDQLYTPGNSNGWNQGASQMLTTTDYIKYTGFAVLDGEFKFTSALDWSGANYGSTGVAGEMTNDGGAGNLNAPERSLYWCEANISALTYSIAPTRSWGIIGDATPNGREAETTLTPSADLLKYTGTITMKGSGEYKFRANNAWDISLGGNPENLEYNGGNIPTPGAGTYEVTLDFSKVPYTVTFVKK